MLSKNNSVLVIGGGMAGLQASIDLGNAGVNVYLIENNPYVGGRMTLLHKVFPTLESSLDLLTQKTSDVTSNQNIKVLLSSDIREIRGEVGNFKVEITKRPRYIDGMKCTSCGECSTVCPVSVTKEYEMGLGERKAAYIPHPQSYPKNYIIDKKNCLHFKDDSCSECLSACPENAVNFDQELKDEEIEVDAIIVATGSNLFKNEKKAEYGYGLYKNVITGIEFEQLYDPVGPTEGKIIRISDGEKPKTVAFILCVGFRDEKNNKYCCRTGCMSALKHAYLLKNQYGDEVEAYILYTDIRAAGLGYEEFYRKARETGLILIKGKPSEVRLLPDNSCTIEVFEANTHKLIAITSDLVVLEGGATPNNNLREILKIPLRQDGFYAESHPQLSPTETRVKGVFLAGTAHGPKDIPETITHASSAAMKVLTFLRKISSKTEI